MRTAIEVAIRAAKGYGEDSCAVFAGGITYFTLLSLFPLTLFALAIAGFIFQTPDEQANLVDHMLDALPLDESSGRDDIETLIESVVTSRGTLGVIGLVGAAYSASALFGAVRTSLNVVLKASKKRPFFMGKAIDLGLVLLFTVLLVLSVSATAGIALAQQFSEELFGKEASVWTSRLLNLAYAFVPTAVSSLVFFLMFTLVPARRLSVRHTLRGAIVSAVLFEILKVGFTVYITNFGNYNATYGALGFIIILLVFFNFSSQVMLLGAEVARASTEVSEASGAARFEASTAMFRKVRETAAKVPLVGPSVSNAAENLEDALDGDEQDAPPVPAPPPETSGPALASSLAPRSSLAASQPHENRPASGAFLLLLGGLLIGFVAIARRK